MNVQPHASQVFVSMPVSMKKTVWKRCWNDMQADQPSSRMGCADLVEIAISTKISYPVQSSVGS